MQDAERCRKSRFGAAMLVAMTGLGLLSGVGQAQDRKTSESAGPGEGRWLQRLDTNQDLTVTQEEFLKRRVDRFAKLDIDGDGVLSTLELTRSVRLAGLKRRERVLFGLDENKDGKISRLEFERLSTQSTRAAATDRGAGRFSPRSRAVRGWRFEFFDRNGDGFIDRAEFDAAQAEHGDFIKRRVLHVVDRDGDGRVTLEEYTADARARFARLDINRDGKITEADLAPDMRLAWAER